MNAIEKFLDELRADRELAPCAADLADALQQIDFEGDGNREAAAFYEALYFIIKQSASVKERVRALNTLFGFPIGPTKVRLHRDGDSIIVERMS